MALSKKWRLSPFDYHVDAFIAPILSALAASLEEVVLWQLTLGLLAWSLAEYCLHRFVFHRHFRADHWAHHVDAQAHIGISGTYIGVASTVALWAFYWLHLASLYSGFMLGYFFYLITHYLMHRPHLRISRLVKPLAKNHEMHHQRGIEKNFGVTSPLWDFVFRTYARAGRTT